MPLRHRDLSQHSKFLIFLHAFDRENVTKHKNDVITELYFDPCLNLPVCKFGFRYYLKNSNDRRTICFKYIQLLILL